MSSLEVKPYLEVKIVEQDRPYGLTLLCSYEPLHLYSYFFGCLCSGEGGGQGLGEVLTCHLLDTVYYVRSNHVLS